MWVQDLYPKVKCKCQNKETLDSKSDTGTPLSILVNHNMLVWFYLCTNSPTQREWDMPAKCRYKKCMLKKNLLTLRISTISPGSLLEDTYLQLTQQAWTLHSLLVCSFKFCKIIWFWAVQKNVCIWFIKKTCYGAILVIAKINHIVLVHRSMKYECVYKRIDSFRLFHHLMWKKKKLFQLVLTYIADFWKLDIPIM